jgi:hypothetical protein
MSAESKSQVRYTYSFRIRAEDSASTGFNRASRDEIQDFVNASLGMMTGGCKVCEFAHRNNSPAMFCEKKKSPVSWGSPRCEYFIRSSIQTQNLLA